MISWVMFVVVLLIAGLYIKANSDDTVERVVNDAVRSTDINAYDIPPTPQELLVQAPLFAPEEIETTEPSTRSKEEALRVLENFQELREISPTFVNLLKAYNSKRPEERPNFIKLMAFEFSDTMTPDEVEIFFSHVLTGQMNIRTFYSKLTATREARERNLAIYE